MKNEICNLKYEIWNLNSEVWNLKSDNSWLGSCWDNYLEGQCLVYNSGINSMSWWPQLVENLQDNLILSLGCCPASFFPSPLFLKVLEISGCHADCPLTWNSVISFLDQLLATNNLWNYSSWVMKIGSHPETHCIEFRNQFHWPEPTTTKIQQDCSPCVMEHGRLPGSHCIAFRNLFHWPEPTTTTTKWLVGLLELIASISETNVTDKGW